MNKNNSVNPATFEEIFDSISGYIETHPELSNELVIAREDYFRLTGKLNETDASFTNRMNSFLLWFTFDWKCSDSLKSPFDHFKQSVFKGKTTSMNGELITDIEEHVHSLFDTKKLTDHYAIVKDLYGKKKYEIIQPDYLYGSPKGTYFESRLFKINGKYRFSNYFIQHPLEVKKDIHKACKQLSKKGDSIKPFLIHLHSYHTKWERYRNINIKSIYHFDKSIPEAK
ncbi:MAG: hypothetical protein MJE63_02720 [Proteobacteria bacterium]|nr:hypothetical protein [Pseudomonadota bacterium]